MGSTSFGPMHQVSHLPLASPPRQPRPRQDTQGAFEHSGANGRSFLSMYLPAPSANRFMVEGSPRKPVHKGSLTRSSVPGVMGSFESRCRSSAPSNRHGCSSPQPIVFTFPHQASRAPCTFSSALVSRASQSFLQLFGEVVTLLVDALDHGEGPSSTRTLPARSREPFAVLVQAEGSAVVQGSSAGTRESRPRPRSRRLSGRAPALLPAEPLQAALGRSTAARIFSLIILPLCPFRRARLRESTDHRH